jgi:hypothetical protein
MAVSSIRRTRSARHPLPTILSSAAARTRAMPSGPLWRGARYTHEDRARALRRGLRFIYRLACVPTNFEDYGDDFLWCFYSLSVSTADPWIRQEAWRMGQERARRWRRDYPRLPPNVDAADICGWIFGSLAADALDVHDERLTRALTRAARTFKPADYLCFDPVTEPIPRDVPADCTACAAQNKRGRRRCRQCGARLRMSSRYDVMTDALVTAHAGALSGIRLGRDLADVTARLAALRPYRGPCGGSHRAYLDLVYTVTHVVYVLNDYGLYRLRPSWLPHEFAFLKKHLRQSIADDDPETTGEFLDTLKAFGLTEADPVIRAGMDFVLSRQHFDGSWGTPGTDCYTSYHATWTAIGGLMDYAFRGERTRHAEALRRAQGRHG